MKTAGAPAVASQELQRVEFQVKFSGGPESKGPRTPKSASAPVPVEKASLDRLPKITKLLVLGHHFEILVREGVVKDYAEIARVTGLTRARVTQITNLMLLAPEIQELILNVCPRLKRHDTITEQELRVIVIEVDWREQHRWFTETVGPSIDF